MHKNAFYQKNQSQDILKNSCMVKRLFPPCSLPSEVQTIVALKGFGQHFRIILVSFLLFFFRSTGYFSPKGFQRSKLSKVRLLFLYFRTI